MYTEYTVFGEFWGRLKDLFGESKVRRESNRRRLGFEVRITPSVTIQQHIVNDATSHLLGASVRALTANPPIATFLSLTPTFSTSVPGQVDTEVATVTAADGSSPAGLITIFVNGNFAGYVPLNGVSGNDQATFTDALLPSGDNNIQAIFTAGFGYAGSSASATQTVSGNAQIVLYAGVTATDTVSILNPDGSIDTTYTGTQQFSSSDPNASLPSNYPYQLSDQGVHTFDVTMESLGYQTVTSTDTLDPSITSTTTVYVIPHVADHLVVTQQPSDTVAGQPIAPAVTVAAEDSLGNVVTTGNYQVLLVVFGQALFGNNTATTSNGTATFDNLSMHTAGLGYILQAGAVGLTDTSSAPFSILPGPTTQFLVSAPASVNAGVPFNVTVFAEDQFFNLTPNFTDAVQFSSSDPAAGLPGIYPFVTGDFGVHAFMATLQSANVQTITVTDTSNTSITGSTNVTVMQCDTPNLSPSTASEQVGIAIGQAKALSLPAALVANLTAARDALTAEDAPTAAQNLTDFKTGLASLVQQGVISQAAAATIFTPTVVYWTGSGDGSSWNDPANWNDNAIPDECDDVYIQTTPGLVIEHPSGDVTIHSLHSYNPINYTGSLTLATHSEVHEAFNFNGRLEQMFGTLEFDGGGSLAGTFQTDSDNGLFLFSKGTFVDHGTLYQGAGTTQVGDATGQSSAVYLIPLNGAPPAAPAVSQHLDNTKLVKGGTIDGAGLWVQAAKTLSWTGGSMAGSGTTQINPGAKLVISGNAIKQLNQRNLVNFGQASATGGKIEVTGGGTIANKPFAEFDLNSIDILAEQGGTGTFTNEGVVSQLAASSVHISIDFQNSNKLLVNGFMEIKAPGTLKQAVAGAFVEIAPNSTLSVENFELGAGTVKGMGTLSISRSMNWTGGTMVSTNNQGLTRIGLDASVTINGRVEVDSRTVNNLGLVNFSGGRMNFVSGVFNNAGTFNINGNLTLNAPFRVPPVPMGTFNNHGRVVKTAVGVAGAASIRMDFNNLGTVEVKDGTIDFFNDGTHSGKFVMANPFTGFVFSRLINFTDQVFLPGSSFDGNGQVTVEDHVHFTVRAGTRLRIENFTLNGIAKDTFVTGPGDLSAHVFTWIAGSLTGTGTITLKPGDVMNINTIAGKAIVNRRILNSGTINWNDGDVDMSSGATIVNNGAGGGGKFDVLTNGHKIANVKPDQTKEEPPTSDIVLENGGSLVDEQALALSTNQIDVFLKNEGGKLEIRDNTLVLGWQYTQNAGSTLVQTGQLKVLQPLDLNGGRLTLKNGHLAATTLEIASGGVLAGTGTITGDVDNDGTISVGNNGTPGVMNVNGAFLETPAAKLQILVGGKMPGTDYSQINFGGQALLGGTLEATLINGFAPKLGESFKVVTFAKSEDQFSNKTIRLPKAFHFEITYQPTSVSLGTRKDK